MPFERRYSIASDANRGGNISTRASSRSSEDVLAALQEKKNQDFSLHLALMQGTRDISRVGKSDITRDTLLRKQAKLQETVAQIKGKSGGIDFDFDALTSVSSQIDDITRILADPTGVVQADSQLEAARLQSSAQITSTAIQGAAAIEAARISGDPLVEAEKVKAEGAKEVAETTGSSNLEIVKEGSKAEAEKTDKIIKGQIDTTKLNNAGSLANIIETNAGNLEAIDKNNIARTALAEQQNKANLQIGLQDRETKLALGKQKSEFDIDLAVENATIKHDLIEQQGDISRILQSDKNASEQAIALINLGKLTAQAKDAIENIKNKGGREWNPVEGYNPATESLESMGGVNMVVPNKLAAGIRNDYLATQHRGMTFNTSDDLDMPWSKLKVMPIAERDAYIQQSVIAAASRSNTTGKPDQIIIREDPSGRFISIGVAYLPISQSGASFNPSAHAKNLELGEAELKSAFSVGASLRAL